MPEPLSNIQLKNRLLGAAILVVLAVVLIPLFLGEPKYQTEEVEEPKSTEFESRIQPLPGAGGQAADISQAQKNEITGSGGLVLKKLDDQSMSSGERQENTASPVKIKPLNLEQATTASEEKVVGKTPEPESAAKPAPKPKPAPRPTAELGSGWVVQVGVYSKSANATGVASDLKRIGYAPKVSDVNNNPGQKRVWIGPFASKSEAQKISKRLADKRGDGGYVKEFPF